MRYTTVSLHPGVKALLLEFQQRYERKTASDALEYLFGFLEENKIDLRFDFRKDSLEKLYFMTEDLEKKMKEILKKEDKNTTRIVKILQAQERDILKPIYYNKVKEESEKAVQNELGNFETDKDIEALKKENEKLKNKLYLKERAEEMKSKPEGENHNELYFSLLKKFRKSITGKYTCSLTEEEFMNFKNPV